MKKANSLYLTAIAIMVITWFFVDYATPGDLIKTKKMNTPVKPKEFIPYHPSQVKENTFWFTIPDNANLSFKNGQKEGYQIILDPALPAGIQVELDSIVTTNPKALQNLLELDSDTTFLKPHYYIYMNSLPPGKWTFRVGRMQELDISLASGVLSTAGEYTANKVLFYLYPEFVKMKNITIRAEKLNIVGGRPVSSIENNIIKDTAYFTGNVNKLYLQLNTYKDHVLDFTGMYTQDILIEETKNTKIRITPQRCLRWAATVEKQSNMFRTQKAKYEFLPTKYLTLTWEEENAGF